MKNLTRVLACLMTACVLLAGCGSEDEPEKLCRIEILSEEDGAVLRTLEDLTQDETSAFLDGQEEMDISGVSLEIPGIDFARYESGEDQPEDGLVLEYRVVLYQERTKTAIKSGDDAYEKIIEYVTYRDSDLVKMTICGDAAENAGMKEDFLTLYYEGTELFFANLREAVIGETQ